MRINGMQRNASLSGQPQAQWQLAMYELGSALHRLRKAANAASRESQDPTARLTGRLEDGHLVTRRRKPPGSLKSRSACSDYDN